MALFKVSLAPENEPRIESSSHFLRYPVMSDFPEWAALREQSRAFLKPWEPVWPEDDLTKAGFRRRMRRYVKERREGRSYPFFLFERRNNKMVGGLTLSNVRRGVSQSATLGYWMGEPFAGAGHMSAAVSLVLPFCFNTLRLHRVEAACIPSNQRSIQLLEKMGFRREGYAKKYLLIDGVWQDHLLFACLQEDFASANWARSMRAGGNLKEIL